MPGFKSITAYVDAYNSGANVITSFRKSPTQANTAGNWMDMSMASGNPVPNYYAATPLQASKLSTQEGIYHGGAVSPSNKVLRSISVFSNSANAAPSTWFLLDYLMYYPFIDMDAVGDVQAMINVDAFSVPITLDRYTDGAGVRMMMVNVSPTVGGGQFTVTYVNQDGVEKTTPNHFCTAVTSIATLTATTENASGFMPFLTLAAGDSGVRSVTSVTFTVANGGLASLVLVYPLRTLRIREASVPTEVESLLHAPDVPRVQDGAYLNFIGNTPTGSLASTVFMGMAEFTWG
jgi:hypothetical protein